MEKSKQQMVFEATVENRVLALFHQGEKADVIAKSTGLNINQVIQILKKYGVQ